MAFLLSPKTEGAVSYSFESLLAVSVNGAPAKKYGAADSATVAPGDVISAKPPVAYRAEYYPADPDAEAVKVATGTTPYTVEAVAGATNLTITPNNQ